MLASDNIVDLNNYKKNPTQYKSKLTAEKKQKILDEVKKSKDRWYNFFGTNLERFRDDKFFYLGQQWNQQSQNNYELLGKTAFIFNLIKPIVRQLQGEVASMQPSVNLTVVNQEKVDPSELQLMSDFLRAEMYHSKPWTHYVECFLNQCAGGWGVLQVYTDYVDEYSFDQKVCVAGDCDPLYVGFDPAAEEKTKIDSTFQFKDYFMDKDDFEATYNRPAPAPGQMIGSRWQFLPSLDNKLVIVTDYYKKEFKSKTLVQLTNYENYKVEVLEEDVERAHESYMQTMYESGMNDLNIPPLLIANKRKTKLSVITCYKCIKDDVLEQREWPSKMMPFVFVDGASAWQDGKQFTESFIYNARDAQQNYNFLLSEIYNGIPRSRREQVWLTRDQAAGQEQWLRYPDRQQGHCEYNFDINVPNGPIFRPPEELPQTLFTALQTAKQAVYDALGIMPVGGTELPNNLAAVTVGRIITQTNLSFVRLINNLFDGIQTVTEIFLDLVPKIYDSERIIATVDASGKMQASTINTVENNKDKNKLSDFLYKVQVNPVASFAIQQQELREDLYKLIQADPVNATLISDLIASTLQTPIAPQLTQRLATRVPPEIAAKEQGKPAPPPAPPSPQQQLMAAQAQKAQADAQLSQAKAQAEQFNAMHKNASLQNDMQNNAAQYQLELQKLQAQRDETIANTQASYISASAEVQKAQLDRDAKVTAALAQMHKASTDASKNS
jgi:hypothetical protein